MLAVLAVGVGDRHPSGRRAAHRPTAHRCHRQVAQVPDVHERERVRVASADLARHQGRDRTREIHAGQSATADQGAAGVALRSRIAACCRRGPASPVWCGRCRPSRWCSPSPGSWWRSGVGAPSSLASAATDADRALVEAARATDATNRDGDSQRSRRPRRARKRNATSCFARSTTSKASTPPATSTTPTTRSLKDSYIARTAEVLRAHRPRPRRAAPDHRNAPGGARSSLSRRGCVVAVAVALLLPRALGERSAGPEHHRQRGGDRERPPRAGSPTAGDRSSRAR